MYTPLSVYGKEFNGHTLVILLSVTIQTSFHIVAFLVESILWIRQKTHKLFGVRTEDAKKVESFAYNQGFYNLFLALINLCAFVLINILGYADETSNVDFYKGLMFASSLVMTGAGIILILSTLGNNILFKVGLFQAVPPAIVCYYCLL